MKNIHRISSLPTYVYGIVRDIIISFVEYSKLSLLELKIVTLPGVGFGEYGEGYMHCALRENEHRIKPAVKGIRSLLYSSKKK